MWDYRWLPMRIDLTDLDREFAAYYDDTPIYHEIVADFRPQPSPFLADYRDTFGEPEDQPARRDAAISLLVIAAACVVSVLILLRVGGVV